MAEKFKNSDLIIIAALFLAFIIFVVIAGVSYMQIENQKDEACENNKVGNVWNGNVCLLLNGSTTAVKEVEEINDMESGIDLIFFIVALILGILIFIFGIKIAFRFGKNLMDK